MMPPDEDTVWTIGTPAEVDVAIRRLVGAAAVEVIPLKNAEEKVRQLPVGTTVTITCSPKFGVERTLDQSERAARAGYRIVPHLAARQFATVRELREVVTRLGDSGIADLYVVGGDAAEPAGVFRDAGDLLDALQQFEHGITSVGVGCYPEGHPKIDDDVLTEALRRKQPYAQYMVSQLCFDAGALRTWLREVRAMGISLPLRLGLAAPMSTRKLIELSLKIGVGPSLRYLTKQRGVVSNLLLGSTYDPQSLLLDLGPELVSPEAGIEALHLFSFNQIDPTVEWQRRIGEAGGTQQAG